MKSCFNHIFCFKRFWLLFAMLSLLYPIATVCEEAFLKYAVSQKMIGDTNENDALASVKIWTESLAEQLGIEKNPLPHLYHDLVQLKDAVSNATADFFYITTEEYFHLRAYFDTQNCIVPVKNDSPYEKYILLAHKDSGILSLKDLAQSSLVMFDNSRMIVGPAWLDNLLFEENLGSLEKHFKSIELVSKVNMAILPVFFQKKNACFVTRDAYLIMAELNPQLLKQLVIVAESEPFVPAGLFFRKGYASSFKQRLYEEITQWTEIPSYRQLAVIFQLDGLIPSESTILDETVLVFQKHIDYFGTTTALRQEQE